MFQIHGADECVHSLNKRAIKFLMPSPNRDYNQKCRALKLLPPRKTTITQQMYFNAKGCSRQSPTVPERSHNSF